MQEPDRAHREARIASRTSVPPINALRLPYGVLHLIRNEFYFLSTDIVIGNWFVHFRFRAPRYGEVGTDPTGH
jgi:hypothetical protein